MEISEEYSKELIRKYTPNVLTPLAIAVTLSAAVYPNDKQRGKLICCVRAARKRYEHKVECLFENEAYDDLEDSLDLFA